MSFLLSGGKISELFVTDRLLLVVRTLRETIRCEVSNHKTFITDDVCVSDTLIAKFGYESHCQRHGQSRLLLFTAMIIRRTHGDKSLRFNMV